MVTLLKDNEKHVSDEYVWEQEEILQQFLREREREDLRCNELYKTGKL